MGDERPLLPYTALTGVFNAALLTSLWVAHRRGRLRPVPARDIVLLAVATQKLSRLVTRDKVTSFLRAPFTRPEKESGQGEVVERPRGTGARRAVGELVTCPYCISQWIGAGLVVGHQFAPRTTRTVATIFTAVSISDFVQLGYRAARDRAQG